MGILIYGAVAVILWILCVIPLIFGILFLADVFSVSEDVKYGVGITILVIGSLGCCVGCLIMCISCTETGSSRGGGDMVMRMYAIQSGMNLTQRYNFKKKTNTKSTSNKKIDKALLLKMLKRENELRLSKAVLQEYEDEAVKYFDNDDPNRYSLKKPFLGEVVNNLQKKVVNEFGFGPTNKNEEEYALEYLRSARALYPDDDEIKNSANYLKYNLVKKFPFNIDDYYKDINLLDLNNNLIKLSEIIKKDVLNVIISGSIT